MLAAPVFGARQSWVIVLLVFATVLAAAIGLGSLKLDPNVSALLPDQGQSKALRRYLKAFGGSDLGLILVTAPASLKKPAPVLDDKVAAIVDELSKQPSIEAVNDRLKTQLAGDPMALWRYADASTQAKLAAALRPEAMRKRLRVSRSLLVADPSGATAKLIARDPLRLSQIVLDSIKTETAGVRAGPEGQLESRDGRSRLILLRPRGQALRSADARRFVDGCESVLKSFRLRNPDWTFALTGGHAIAAATEKMLVRDLRNSTVLSLLLAALVFGLSFRRIRAIFAVMPPLVLGSIWTVSLASLIEGGLSAIAMAFVSVVIGVGVDTGVHVYAALLEARRDGLDPQAAAHRARRETYKPVLFAATAAAAAFASLSLSRIAALRQLGWLCAAGEMLTALAIVVVTPWLGSWLERNHVAPASEKMAFSWLGRLFKTKGRAVAVLVVTMLPFLALALGFVPRIGEALVALRPAKLKPLQVQEAIYTAFGGRPGQWVVLLEGKDRDALHQRSDALVEALNRMPSAVQRLDSISQIVPSQKLQQSRLAIRDRLNLPQRAKELAAALEERWEDSDGNLVGFRKERFATVLAHMEKPTQAIVRVDPTSKSNILVHRYIAQWQNQEFMVLYVLPKRGFEKAVEAQIRAVDSAAAITGYGRLEASLAQNMRHDLPRVALLALVLVMATLGLSLRRARDVMLALLVITTQAAIVMVLMRLFAVPLHIYNALVLPVLLGITVDEGMFLLYRARKENDLQKVLAQEGPPIRTTALTTAAGFAGLLICDFEGLGHVGAVGALGSLAGLVTALLVIPAGLRLAGHTTAEPSPKAS